MTPFGTDSESLKWGSVGVNWVGHPGDGADVAGVIHGRVEPVLVDLGFWFPPTGLGPPTWLMENVFAPLWGDDRPEQRQQAAPPQADAIPVVADVRTLARLLACVLTGQCQSAIEPPTGAAPVWGTLVKAVRGEYATITEFHDALQTTHLSAHFRTAFPPSNGGQRRTIAVLLALVVLVGVVGTVLCLPREYNPLSHVWKRWQGLGSPDESGQNKSDLESGTYGSPPNKPPPPKLAELIHQFDAAPVTEQSKLLLQIVTEAHSADPGQAQHWVAKPRAVYLQHWIKRYQETEARAANLDERFEVADQLQTLHEELAGLIRDLPADPKLQEKEKQCLDFSALRVQELRLGH